MTTTTTTTICHACGLRSHPTREDGILRCGVCRSDFVEIVQEERDASNATSTTTTTTRSPPSLLSSLVTNLVPRMFRTASSPPPPAAPAAAQQREENRSPPQRTVESSSSSSSSNLPQDRSLPAIMARFSELMGDNSSSQRRAPSAANGTGGGISTMHVSSSPGGGGGGFVLRFSSTSGPSFTTISGDPYAYASGSAPFSQGGRRGGGLDLNDFFREFIRTIEEAHAMRMNGGEVVRESDVQAALASAIKEKVPAGDTRQCPVCLDAMEGEMSMTPPNCSHTFCSACLTKWIQAGKFSCPVCRSEIRATEVD